MGVGAEDNQELPQEVGSWRTRIIKMEGEKEDLR